MDTLTYHLEAFDGPLDLLLSLIQKNKVEITDIPIALICDQYMAYVTEAEKLDMELASEFIVMASELMLIKSRMLLPKAEPEEEDPRAELADALLKYQQAKLAAALLGQAYQQFSRRLVKDTDEISVDKTFVADQSVSSLSLATRRIYAHREEQSSTAQRTFSAMISTPIVPVEAKIVGILRHFEAKERVTMSTLLEDAVSLPDMIAVFLGILELVKLRRIVLIEQEDVSDSVYGIDSEFMMGQEPPPKETEIEAPSASDSPVLFHDEEVISHG